MLVGFAIGDLEQAEVVSAYKRSCSLWRAISVWRGTSKGSVACGTVMIGLYCTTEAELLRLGIPHHKGIIMATSRSISTAICKLVHLHDCDTVSGASDIKIEEELTAQYRGYREKNMGPRTW